MRWRVEVKHTGQNVRLLKDVLSPLSITLVEDGEGHFLTSEQFETLNSAADVYTIATRVVGIIEEVTKNHPEFELGLEIGNVVDTNSMGHHIKHAFACFHASANATATMDAVVIRGSKIEITDEEKERLERERKEREYQSLLKAAVSLVASAFQDGRAMQVQRLLHGELTPQNMGHIADLIQADMGKAIKNLASSHQFTRFYRSINHPEVFGEQARHIVSEVPPPPNPMSLSEAQQFIKKVAARWMEEKSGLYKHKNPEATPPRPPSALADEARE